MVSHHSVESEVKGGVKGDDGAPALPTDLKRCPRCRERSGQEILWGDPTPEAMELLDSGRYVIGGCVVAPGIKWCCRECDYEWGPRSRRRRTKTLAELPWPPPLQPCPFCTMEAAMPILYGFPSNEVVEAIEAQQVVHRGCLIPNDRTDWLCQACGREWAND